METPAHVSETLPPSPARAKPLLRTLMLCDLVDSTRLLERLGDQRGADLFRKHDRLVRALLHVHAGREIDKTDGFLAMFKRPAEAAAFALGYMRSLRQLGVAENVSLEARVGIHVGDVLSWNNDPSDVARGAKLVEVEGLVKSVSARLMQLARPGQILLSGVAYTLAHRAHDELDVHFAPLRWRAYGRYRFKGVPDPIAVFEVGEPEHAPLRAPPWSGKAHREVPFWRRPAALAVEGVALLALAAVPVWYAISPEPAIAFAQRDWVVVGDLKNLTGEIRLDESISTAFRIGLEQSRHVNVVSDLKARQTVTLMQRDPDKTPIDRAIGAEIALRDGARALILPTVAEVGGRVRVTAEVVDPTTLTTVWSESADGVGENSVLPSVDEVNRKLRVRLGEALATVSNESKPLERVTTKNLDALRAYSLGVSAYLAGDFKQTVALYRQAIALDPDFALARLDLGAVLTLKDPGENSEAISEMRKAVALSDRLSARHALYAQAWLSNFESPKTALEKWRLLARMYPDFTRATGGAGFFLYQTANEFEAAIAMTEQNAIAQNPGRANGDYLLGTLYLGAERYADAQLRFESAAKSGRSTGAYAAYLHAAQRRFDRADQVMASIKADGLPGSDAQLWYPRIMLALDRGNWNDARAAVSQARKETSALKGTLDDEFELIELGMRALTESGESLKPSLAAFIRKRTDSKQRDTPEEQFNLLFAAYLAAHTGATDLARSVMDNVAPITRSGDYPYLASLGIVVDAELARAVGQPERSIALLKPGMNGSEYYFSHRVLMDAYAAQGQYAEALAESKWLARHRGRAYVEQFGQASLQPFNVSLSTFALLDAAEFSAQLKIFGTSRSLLADLRRAWPEADRQPFLKKRLQALDGALGAGARAP